MSSSVQTAAAEYHRFSGLNNRNLLLTVLVGGKAKIQCLVKARLLVLRQHLLALDPYMVERAKELSRVAFIRVLISFMRVLSS